MKHNRANSPKVKKCISKELEKIKCREFVERFFDACEEYGYSIDTLSKDYKYSMNSLSKDYGEKEKEKQK